MIRKPITLLLCLFLLVVIVPGSPGDPQKPVLEQYRRADSFYRVPNATPLTDSMAMTGFIQVIGVLEKAQAFEGRDTLLAQSWLKRGVLLEVKADYMAAKNAYCRALAVHSAKDSLGVIAAIYAGASYYNLNNFDSASYYLLRADSLIHRFHDLDDEVRLYNTLGVLYYDNGNYVQGKNYFNKALGIVEAKHPFDTASAVSLQSNIATSFYRLGQYEEALSIYRRIIRFGVIRDQINMNMGRAYAGLRQYELAMASFRRVNAARIPGVINEMGYTLLGLHKTDSAAWWLDRLQGNKRPAGLNELDLGINGLYKAELLTDQGQYMEALERLQQSIIIFSRDFKNPDIYTNPTQFAGAFGYYRLFDVLFKKASVFQLLYRARPKEEYLQAAYETYKATLQLLRYIEKSYDTDDAKLFLKQRNGSAYRAALSVCLELDRLHPKQGYLEQAFVISEKSKASIISANLKERVFKADNPSEEGLLQRERNIKFNIARLSGRSESAADSGEIAGITRERAALEIELSRLQKELEQNGRYYRLKYEDSVPGTRELQKSLTDDQALISLALTDDALHIFGLTKNGFTYTRVDSLASLERDVQAWLDALKTTESGRRFRGEATGARLYTQLVKPLQGLVAGKQEWIIVPDGFLYFLPFESLPSDAAGKTLLETSTISYQFAARLLLSPAEAVKDHAPGQVLAFAPFAKAGGTYGAEHFDQLPASAEEIAGLRGVRYIDAQATKEAFLRDANKFPIVHLATHAVSSIDNASASFIGFYPAHHSQMDDRLYLGELYGLNMNATRLMIISACETGQGKLVNSEGVISLARAFAYAGCESTVNSLWKADDKATSYILQRFHIYLQEGETRSGALRKAKLDYLASDAVNKSPGFWAHLILTGAVDPLYPSHRYGLWAALGSGMLLLSGLAVALRRRKKN